MVQFVYPDYELPHHYLELIDSVDHIDIERDNADADVSVFTGVQTLAKLKSVEYPNAVIRLSKEEFFESLHDIQEAVKFQPSLNIVITGIQSFTEPDFEKYKDALAALAENVIDKMKSNKPVKVNLLTDRIMLTSMNNCNAGNESITLAPDGNFYICPAFYFDRDDNVGNPAVGADIPNPQLYKLANAPICRTCDAYQCRRCVWLNRKTTLEVNTPSHEQCVVAHLERNASRSLLSAIKDMGIIKTDMTIPQIDYLDPFYKVKR